jgi:hypothetical protein
VRRVGLTDPAAAAKAARKPEPVYAPGSVEWQRQQAEREGRLPAIDEKEFRRELHDEAISGRPQQRDHPIRLPVGLRSRRADARQDAVSAGVLTETPQIASTVRTAIVS